MSTAGPRAWQSVYVVFAILLLPFLLLQFLAAVDATPTAALNVAWIFFVTAAAAAAAGLVADVRYALLLASIAVIVSWAAVWHKILSGGLLHHYGVDRGLLVIIGLLLVAAAYAVYRSDPLRALRPGQAATPEPERWTRAHDVVTGAAIAGVVAGALTFSSFLPPTSPAFTPLVASPSLLWDIELLVASLLAVLWGSRFGVRGPTYVGAIGLLIFLIDIGSEVGIPTPQATIVGWPLVLVLLGAAAFASSLIPGPPTPDVERTIRGVPPAAAPPPTPTGGPGA
jgi:hypothetical protein